MDLDSQTMILALDRKCKRSHAETNNGAKSTVKVNEEAKVAVNQFRKITRCPTITPERILLDKKQEKRYAAHINRLQKQSLPGKDSTSSLQLDSSGYKKPEEAKSINDVEYEIHMHVQEPPVDNSDEW